MKTKYLIFLTLLMLYVPGLVSQNAKRSSQSFKYEYMPFYPQPKEYNTYRVVIESNSNDGVPLNKRKLYYKEFYFWGYKNLTEVNTIDLKDRLPGGAVNPAVEVSNPNVDTDLEVTVSYGNIELIDKSVLNSIPEQRLAQPGEVNYINFQLTFNFPYHIKIYDRRKNQIVLDSLVDKTRTILYPKDYAEGVAFPGFTSKQELDLNYKKIEKDFYYLSKGVFMAPTTRECSALLRSTIGYYRDGFSMGITRVKSKKPAFDICDTASTILEVISDSISLNSKNDKHINWHTKGLMSKAVRLETIWNDMLTNEIYVGEFKDISEKAEYLKGMRMNLAYALMLQDKFDAALAALDEASPELTQNGGVVNNDKVYARDLRVLIKREKHLYSKHKSYYNFN